MPSADQVNSSDQTGSERVQKPSTNCNSLTNHGNGLHVNGCGRVNGLSNENGRVTMETVNAHLIKSGGVICLDKSPVKPVIIESNGTDTDSVAGNKMENGVKVSNGCHGVCDGKSLPDQNGKEEATQCLDSDQSSTTEDKERRKKLSSTKKPASFDLLPLEISKTRKPSRRGKLARQRTVSETSYQKETHRLTHAKSDPTDLTSLIVQEEEISNDAVKKEEDGKIEETMLNDKKMVKEEIPEQGSEEKEDGQNTKIVEKEVDTLAEQLESNLKIASVVSNSEVQKGDKEISDLADELQKGLSVKDEAKNESKVKVEPSESSSKMIEIKKEKEVDDKESSSEKDVKQEERENKDCASKLIVKKEPADATSFSKRLSEDKSVKDNLVPRGPIRARQPDQIPMTSYSGHQRMPQQSRSIVIPGFQETFIQNTLRHNQITEEMQRQAWLQKQQQQMHVQHVQPPFYSGPNQIAQQQPIPVPPPAQGSQTIIVPPVGSANHQTSMSSANYLTHNGYVDRYHQQQQQGMPFQHQYNNTMVLQQPGTQNMGIQEQSREPVEGTWPPLSEDVYSETSSNICSPPQIDDNELHSPHSAMSETSSTDFVGLGPVSPGISQGSPAVAQSVAGSSPYHPSSPEITSYHPNSPEITSVLSPPAATSPGSPTSQQIITKGYNMGVVVITDPTGKPSPKRQCMEVEDFKEKSINNIVDYLKSGSPGSPVFEQEDSATPSQMTPPHTIPDSPTPSLQQIVTTQHNPPMESDQQFYHPAASPTQSSSTCDTPSPSPNPTLYHPNQPSPTPGLSPVDVQQYPYGATTVPNYYPYRGQIMMNGAPNVAMTPTQDAHHQGHNSLQEWRIKVGRLTDKQLREQDDDKDTVLHVAIIQDQDYLTQALVERVKFTEAMNMKNKLSQTPVYVAALINRPEIVMYLLENGGDPTIPAEQAGDTPLHHAAKHGYVGVIKAIIQGYGRSSNDFMDKKNFEGKSPLHYAVESHGEKDSMSDQMETIDSLQTIQILMTHGATATCQDWKSGKTPLHYAVEMHKMDISKLLLNMCDNAGDLVNCQTYNGNTALHLVVGRREIPKEQILEVVALLMARGANVSIENAEKEAAVRLVQPGHDVIKKHLSGQAHDGSRR